MKQVIKINLHSFVDIITNSSSELFVLSQGNEIEAVREMLQFMLDNWNAMAAKGVFGSHYVKNNRKFLGKEELFPQPIKTFEETFGRIYVYTREQYEKDVNTAENAEWHWGYEKEHNIGRIFIESAYDNSIPIEMFDWINSAFGWDTQRYHLG